MFLKFYPISTTDKPRLVEVPDPERWAEQASELIGAQLLDHTTDINGDTIFCDHCGALKTLPTNQYVRHMFKDYPVHGAAVVIPGTEELTFFGPDAPIEYDMKKPQKDQASGMMQVFEMIMKMTEDAE